VKVLDLTNVFTPHNSVIALKERRLGFISIPIAKRAKRVLAVSEWEKRGEDGERRSEK